MRVSDQSFYGRSRLYLSNRRSDVAEAQRQASTGKRVQRPSDDPLAAALSTKERAREQRLQASMRSIDAGRDRADAQDEALGEVAERLRRAKELSLQAANDLRSPEERLAIASEISAIRDAIVGVANRRDGQTYVFSGNRSDSPAYDTAGTFLGDSAVPQTEVAEGVRIDAGVAGDAAFGAGTPEDVFTVLEDFVTALTANDEVGIRAAIDAVEGAHDNVTTQRAHIGGLQQSLDAADAVTERLRDSTIERQSELVAVDETDAYVDLQRTLQAYQAAVQIASQMPPQGLVNR